MTFATEHCDWVDTVSLYKVEEAAKHNEMEALLGKLEKSLPGRGSNSFFPD